jgi:multidrug resistance efflux pump
LIIITGYFSEKELSHIVVPQAVTIRDEDAAANQKRVEAQVSLLFFWSLSMFYCVDFFSATLLVVQF